MQHHVKTPVYLCTLAYTMSVTDNKNKRNGGLSTWKNELPARSKGTNRVEVPEARGALDRFKFEVANEIGVDLKEGYNGHLTTAQAGSVGGEMVRKMIRRQEEEMSR